MIYQEKKAALFVWEHLQTSISNRGPGSEPSRGPVPCPAVHAGNTSTYSSSPCTFQTSVSLKGVREKIYAEKTVPGLFISAKALMECGARGTLHFPPRCEDLLSGGFINFEITLNYQGNNVNSLYIKNTSQSEMKNKVFQ